MSKTPEERIAAVEEIRSQHYPEIVDWKIKKVVRIIKKSNK